MTGCDGCGDDCHCAENVRALRGSVPAAPETAQGDLQALREELARLQARVSMLEEQGRAHASRRICALMTEITTLETDILHREVTTSDLKKAGMRTMGVEK